VEEMTSGTEGNYESPLGVVNFGIITFSVFP
jgi:hypothetical protein